MKPKKCRCGCGMMFTPRNSMQIAATPECAIAIAKTKKAREVKQQAKVARKAVSEAKNAIKTLSEWRKEAQAVVNRYVRLRDEDLPCISCGRFHQGQYHAGHYLSRGAHPELALDERNIHKQCQPCNTHLSGNQINYRKGLIDRCGIDIVEWLEGPHEPKKYTIADMQEIIAEYKAKIKAIVKK